MENKAEVFVSTVLNHSIDVVGPILVEGVVKANKEGTMPEPLAVWPHPNIEGATIVCHPEGYNIGPFTEKIRREVGLTKTASI